MNTYLVDYENVNVKGLAGVEELTGEDKVIIFYSEQCGTMTFELHERLNQSRAALEFIKASTGSKNSLDFQLVTYLGYLVATDSKRNYVIVTKDDGFKSAVRFWEARGAKISMALNLTGQSKASLEAQICALIPDYTEDAPLIATYIDKYKTKQGLNNALQKQFPNDAKKVAAIYKALKPVLSGMKGK